VSRSCCAPSAICTPAVYLNSSCTQEQKRDQGNTWSTADRYYIHAISLSSPSLAEVFQAYPSPKSDVTHTYTDGQPKIQPFDMSADHVQHPIVWHPQVFRERETMIILSEQDQDPPSEAFLYIWDYLCQETTVPPAATLGHPTTLPCRW
jgi:hypothetical protein